MTRKILNSQKKRCPLALIVLAVFALTLIASCAPEQKTKMYTIGVINFSPAAEPAFEGMKEGLKELGYIEGENIRFLYNGYITDKEKLNTEAQRLVNEGADLIYSMTTPATLAAQKATKKTKTPVVFGPVSNPIEAGLVKNLKTPEGNITGVTFRYQEPKRLQLLKEIMPSVKRISFPYNPFDRSPSLNLQRLEIVAEQLDVILIPQPVRDNEQIDLYLANIPPDVDAIYMPTDSLMASRAKDFANTAKKHKLPLSTPGREGVEDGALMSFGMSIKDLGKQAARLVDQIFRGVSPENLPVEVAEFYTSVNLQTADIIGITISDSLLRRAIVIRE
ncbi:MAG: ABC transporter substrate-binding protein [Desulfobulbaceae bacterium]|nr:ABC transporter substrate-binding protein [Desulfobulbaceae bacterium]